MSVITAVSLAEKIVSAGAARRHLPRRDVAGYGDVMLLKEALPAGLADLVFARR